MRTKTRQKLMKTTEQAKQKRRTRDGGERVKPESAENQLEPERATRRTCPVTDEPMFRQDRKCQRPRYRDSKPAIKPKSIAPTTRKTGENHPFCTCAKPRWIWPVAGTYHLFHNVTAASTNASQCD